MDQALASQAKSKANQQRSYASNLKTKSDYLIGSLSVPWWKHKDFHRLLKKQVNITAYAGGFGSWI